MFKKFSFCIWAGACPLQQLTSSSEHRARILAGLPVAKSGLGGGEHKPTIRRPSLSNPFVILDLEKSKCSFSRDEAPAPFHRNGNIYKGLLREASALSGNVNVAVNVLLHLWLPL